MTLRSAIFLMILVHTTISAIAQEPDDIPIDWLDRAFSREIVTRGDLYRSVSLLAYGGWGPVEFGRVSKELLRRGWIGEGGQEKAPVTRGEVARLFFQAYRLRRSWTTIAGLSGRYAHMELVHRGILSSGSELRYARGEDLNRCVLYGMDILRSRLNKAPLSVKVRRVVSPSHVLQGGGRRNVRRGDIISTDAVFDIGPEGRVECIFRERVLVVIRAKSRVRLILGRMEGSDRRFVQIDLHKGSVDIFDYNRLVSGGDLPFFFWMESQEGITMLTRPAFQLAYSDDGSIEEFAASNENVIEQVRSVLGSNGSGPLLDVGEGRALDTLFSREMSGARSP